LERQSAALNTFYASSSDCKNDGILAKRLVEILFSQDHAKQVDLLLGDRTDFADGQVSFSVYIVSLYVVYLFKSLGNVAKGRPGYLASIAVFLNAGMLDDDDAMDIDHQTLQRTPPEVETVFAIKDTLARFVTYYNKAVLKEPTFVLQQKDEVEADVAAQPSEEVMFSIERLDGVHDNPSGRKKPPVKQTRVQKRRQELVANIESQGRSKRPRKDDPPLPAAAASGDS
jgi:hypothetical protein